MRNQHVEVDQWAVAVLALPGEADPASEIACAALNILGAFVMRKEDDWKPGVQHVLDLWDEHHPDDPFTAVVMATMAFFEVTGERALPEATDEWTRSMVKLMRVVLLENAGRVSESADQIEGIIKGFRSCGDEWGVAMALSTRAQLEAYDGDIEQALATWDEATPILERLGADEDLVFSKMRIVGMRIASAGPEEMTRIRGELGRTLTDARASGHRPAELMARLSLGHLEMLLGNHEASRAQVAYVLGNMESLAAFGGGQFEANVRAAHCVALVRLGEVEDAKKEFDTAAAAAVETQDMPVVAIVAGAAAVIAGQLGDHERSARLIGAADTIRGRVDRSDRMAEELIAELRERLGPTYDKAYAAGAGLDREAAIAFAVQPF
jgi:hypothetical protein